MNQLRIITVFDKIHSFYPLERLAKVTVHIKMEKARHNGTELAKHLGQELFQQVFKSPIRMAPCP